MKEFIKEIMACLLLMIVRAFFGIFLGGFFGLVVGMLVAVLLSLDNITHQFRPETIGIFVVSGAILGALVGASNLLGAKSNDERSILRRTTRRRNSSDNNGNQDSGREI